MKTPISFTRALPGIIFALIIGVLLFSTYQKSNKTGGAELINQAAPALHVREIEGFPSVPLASEGKEHGYVLVNFFASWCTPCQEEHPYLMQLKEEYQLMIVGIAWRDSAANVTKMLEKHGNPYTYVGMDVLDASAFSFGVKGLPESFLIDANKVVVATHRGPITPDVIKEKFLPFLVATSSN
jgi:cytochrome c biogenesis protein CcmG, thiol:disulfide interchange protein DsbE